MSDNPPDDAPKPLPGRRPVRPDGQPMTPAQRQARRRRHLVDRRPLLELLVDLAEADEALAAMRRADPPETNAVWHAETRCIELKGNLAEALGVTVMWPRRQLRKRQRAARGLDW